MEPIGRETLEAARRREQSRRRRVMRSVMIRLRETPQESAPRAAFGPRPVAIVWAAAAALVLAAGLTAWLRGGDRPSFAPQQDAATPGQPTAPAFFQTPGIAPERSVVNVASTRPAPALSFAEELAGVQPGGVARIESGAFREPIRVSKPVRLEAQNGPVIIGQL